MDPWQEAIINHEPAVRFAAFFVIFAALALAEGALPRRTAQVGKSKRWTANLGILVVDIVLVRALLPTAAVGIAFYGQSHGMGLLNATPLPHVVEVALAVVLLDLAIYAQHVVFHSVPMLWRLHRAHHADLDFDLTTGLRFHPIEILLSMVIKAVVILLLGAPPLAVLIFEIALNATAMFSHSNIRLPRVADRYVRLLLVTPDMHRVHHSINRDETDSNFGFNFSFWDRVFRTYRAQPRDDHEAMVIGIPAFRDERRCATITGILSIPFVRDVAKPVSTGEHFVS